MADNNIPSLNNVRYYTGNDPYHYTIDNRPLQDLASNDVAILDYASTIDPTGATPTTAPLTGAENVTIGQSGSILSTTLTAVATWIVGVFTGFRQTGTGTVPRTINSKLADQGLMITDFGAVANGVPYSIVGGTDSGPAINAAIVAANAQGISTVFIPDGCWNIATPIIQLPGVYIQGIGQPCINVTASMTYAISTPLTSVCQNIGWDNINVLCNSLCNAGFYLQWIQGYVHTNCQVEDFNQQGYIIGNPATTYSSDGWIANNVTTFRSHSNIPSNTIGCWIRASTDSNVTNCGFVGATVGLQCQSGGYFFRVHNWARASTGVMQTGFYFSGGGAVVSQCEADTTTVVGFDMYGTGYNLDSCSFYNNNGTTATNGTVIAVRFNTINPASTVTSFTCIGAGSSYQIGYDIKTADNTSTGLTILGTSNTYVVNQFGQACIPTSLQIGDQNQAATNIFLTGSDASNRQLEFGHLTYPMWIWRCNGSNTGSNQGSNLTMFARTDTGGGLFQSWNIVRSTNQWQVADTNTLVSTIHTVYGGGWALKTIGAGFRTAEGTNAKQGTIALTAGSAVVSNTSVTANSRILLTNNASSGTPGFLYISARTPGTSFTITSSSSTDTSTIAYEIFEPA
jgi:hypothetical protein